LESTFTFADRSEEEINTLEEASSLLKLDELKALAKDAKVQGKNKKELLAALQRTSGRQVGLGFVGPDWILRLLKSRSRILLRKRTAMHISCARS
jgi:hypothetical protein